MNTEHCSRPHTRNAFFCVTLLCSSASLFAQVRIGANPASIGNNSSLEIKAYQCNVFQQPPLKIDNNE